MVIKAPFVADIFAKYVEGFVAGSVGHLEYAGAIARRTGEKPAPQAMAGIAAGIELDRRGQGPN